MDLAPGRELDSLIAEKLFGWTLVQGEQHITQGLVLGPQEYYRQEVTFLMSPDKKFESVPNYSTDIAAAWGIVEKLAKEYQNVNIIVSPNKYGYQCHIGIRGNSDDAAANEDGVSAPHAICLAALATIEE